MGTRADDNVVQQSVSGFVRYARYDDHDSLFSGPYLENVRWPEYDVHPNGEGFVFVRLGRSSLRPVVASQQTPRSAS